MKYLLAILIFESLLIGCNQQTAETEKPDARARPNIIFVLTDDHRFDAMGFMGHPFLETPNMDKMAKEGIHFNRALVTTSLCSPSRASIFSGMYAHKHGVVNNYNPVDTTLKFFPEYLEESGYNTAFIGKWHMGGEIDDPQQGFDYWLSFKGQGTYWADGHGTSRVVPQTSMDGYNINGKRVPQNGYITDELTDYAVQWLNGNTDERPFMLFLSHKAVHSDFVAADRHLGRYKDVQLAIPATFENEIDKPMWLTNQRNSRHGADFGYNLPDFDLNKYYRRYCESLLAVDENLGRILAWVENNNEAENTIVIYMGDNGFQFGEHGLIDKRTAYEASIKVPLLMWRPGQKSENRAVEETVANIDIAPTILDFAGIPTPGNMDGRSFKQLIYGEKVDWRKELLYEYYWERNYPYTPTTHALLTDRYKFIRYQGIWDLDEFYDMQEDPNETRNLIQDELYQALIEKHRKRMFELLEETNGSALPLLPDKGKTFNLRNPEKSKPSPFPESFYYK
jgi:N-acetylglucosamine-6-sulfatase